MKDFLKSHLHPLGGRIIFWNLVLLLLIKLIISPSSFHLASFVNSLPVFDSREIISITNEARTINGLSPLRANTKLDLAASEKLNDMANVEYFAHVSPTGINPWFWMKKVGYNYSVAGENLAIGFFTAKETVDAWLNSPSHKANIMNGQYQEMGVAIKGVEIEGRQGILVVQMFGKPSGQFVQVLNNQPSPTPIQTTPQLAVVSPLTLTPQAQGESITVQYLTTDNQIEPISEPIAVKFEDENTEKVQNISNLMNNGFTVYALIIAGFSAAVFLLFERSRGMALKASLNMAVFIISIVIPAVQVSFEGWVF